MSEKNILKRNKGKTASIFFALKRNEAKRKIRKQKTKRKEKYGSETKRKEKYGSEMKRKEKIGMRKNLCEIFA